MDWTKEFDFPVKFTKDYDIRDCKGNVVIPCILFKSDAKHLDRQKRIGMEIERLINSLCTVEEEDGKHLVRGSGYVYPKAKKR